MIRPFRIAMLALGSGSLLVATAALSRDDLTRRQLLAESWRDASWAMNAEQTGRKQPASIAVPIFAADAQRSRVSTAQASPLSPGKASPREAKSGSVPKAAASDQPPAKPVAVFQNASMRPAPQQSGPSIQLGPRLSAENAVSRTSRPVVVLKPDVRPIVDRRQSSTVSADQSRDRFAMKVYHPDATGASDFERLIRPLLTPGLGTATASRTAVVGVGPEDERAKKGVNPLPDEDVRAENASGAGSVPFFGQSRNFLLVHDRPEVLSQIDAIYSDLEAPPKRVVVDALIADVALPDSVPPGWELRQSRFGVIDAEPRTVVNSLRTLGRVCIIATNQLQVIDRQWAQLEWTERACSAASGIEPPAAARDANSCVMTKFRIRPSLLPGGLIRLEVHPTSSRLKEGPSARPQIATVAFTTDILLHAGATAVIAGSLDERPVEVESARFPAMAASEAERSPHIQPQPSLRHETVLLLMPQISHGN